MRYREVGDAEEWDGLVAAHDGHPMQSWGWGELKAHTGTWAAHRVACEDDAGAFMCAAQVLVRKLPWPFRAIAYAARGPVVEDPARVPEAADLIAAWCKEHLHAVSLKVDPAVTGVELSETWRPSATVLLARTAVLDLSPDEDALMASLHSKKARQYIRKARRSGVTVRAATRDDVAGILELYHHTAEQDDFALHEDGYYEAAFDLMGDVNQVFVAEYEGRLQAFLWNVTMPSTAFELWGGVSDEGKGLRANYLLKWEAMCAAKAAGARLYDLNGLLNDGVSRFKMFFVDEPTEWIGAWDRPLSPLYAVWEGALAFYQKHLKK